MANIKDNKATFKNHLNHLCTSIRTVVLRIFLFWNYQEKLNFCLKKKIFSSGGLTYHSFWGKYKKFLFGVKKIKLEFLCLSAPICCIKNCFSPTDTRSADNRKRITIEEIYLFHMTTRKNNHVKKLYWNKFVSIVIFSYQDFGSYSLSY